MPATYTAHLNHRLPFRSETYSLNLHLPSTSSSLSTIHPSKSTASFSSLSLESPGHPAIHCSLGDQPNKLQEWFLSGPCLVILPDSYSGRILDEEEAHTLLSAGAAALSHLKLAWPVYIPVHDALRDAYRGIFVHSSSLSSGRSGGGNASPFSKLNTPTRSPGGTGNDHTISGAVVRLESDSIHSNRSLPVLEFCTLSGQLTMFVSRLRWHAPHAASLCSELATVAVECLERGDSSGVYSREIDEIEDQNLAMAAEALALNSTPSPLKTPPRQRRPSGDDSTVLEENEIDARWEMRRCYHFVATTTTTTSKDQSSSHAAATGVAAGGDISNDEDDDDDAFELLIDTWDEDSVWRPWAAEDDPIERLEVDALWTFPLTTSAPTITQSSSSSISSNNVHRNSHIDANLVAAAIEVEQTGGTSSTTSQQQQQPSSPPLPSSASTWRLAALRRDYQPDDGRRPLILLQSVDQRRHFLRLQSVTELPLQLQTLTSSAATGSLSPSLPFKPPTDALPGETSFSGMLTTLLDHVYYIISATDASDLTSDDWWLQQGNYVPPLTPSYIIQDALRDIFQAVSMPPAWPGTGSGTHTSTGVLREQLNTLESFADEKEEDVTTDGDKINFEILVGKGAPSSSLISRLALHTLRLGNPRAIAMLWTKFLRELRFAHWEASVPLPRMEKKETSMEAAAVVAADVSNEHAATPKEIRDLQYCVLHQKLHLLDMSIRSKLQTHATERKEDQSKQEEDDEGYTSATENSDSTTTTPSVNSTLEGEKALHFLETLPLAAVYAELLAVGFTAAVAILQKAQAATLPAVAAQIEKVKQVGNAWLSDHGVAVIGNGTVCATVLSVVEAVAAAGEETATASITPSVSESNLSDTTASDINDSISDQPLPYQVQLHNHTSLYDSNGTISVSPAVHAMIHSGLGVDGMKTLVQILACVEQTIAAGQSILQRLQSDSVSSTTNQKFSKKAANALVIKALHQGSSNFNFNSIDSSPTNDTSNEENVSSYGCVIDVDATDFEILAAMASNSGQENNTPPRETVASTAWNPTPFWSEWSISMSKGDAVNPLHRLFVRQLPAELRVATVITSEMS